MDDPNIRNAIARVRDALDNIPGYASMIAADLRTLLALAEPSLNEGLRIARVWDGHEVLHEWKLVPIEPTVGMAHAAISATPDCEQPIESDWFKAGYAAMLAAAPTPPTVPTKGDSHGE